MAQGMGLPEAGAELLTAAAAGLAAAALRAAVVVAGVVAGSLAGRHAPQCAACTATSPQRSCHRCGLRQTQMLAFWSTSKRAPGGWHTHISRHAGVMMQRTAAHITANCRISQLWDWSQLETLVKLGTSQMIHPASPFSTVQSRQ